METLYNAFLPPGERAFIKFVGSAENRASDQQSIQEMLAQCDCHRFACYPKNRRPRQLHNGTLLFLGRLVTTGTTLDIRIVGRALASAYLANLHEVTPAELLAHPWKRDWPHAVPLRQAHFVAGVLRNGVSLADLMQRFGADSFRSTQRNAELGRGNLNPKRAYRQQASVELSDVAARWLLEELERCFAQYGQLIPANTADSDAERAESLREKTREEQALRARGHSGGS